MLMEKMDHIIEWLKRNSIGCLYGVCWKSSCSPEHIEKGSFDECKKKQIAARQMTREAYPKGLNEMGGNSLDGFSCDWLRCV